MSSSRKVKGAIFKSHNRYAPYFLGHGCGNAVLRSEAYVYTLAEAKELMAEHDYWARKEDGKWILVYE